MSVSNRQPLTLLSRFLSDKGAHAAVEYALMLAMIVGSALLIIDALGRGSATTFAGLHGKLNGNRATSVMPNDGRGGEPSGVSLVRPEAAESPIWGLARLAVTCALLAGAIGGVLVVYRGRKLRRDAEAAAKAPTVAPPPVEEMRYVGKRQQILRGLANDGRRLLHNQLLVRQIMSAPNSRVTPETPTGELCEIMRTRQIRHLLVCSAEGELQGIISDRDQGARTGKSAAEIMTPRPTFVGPNDLLAHAVTVMLERRFSSLPVLDNGKLVGIITMTDVAMALQCTLQLVDRMIAEIEGVVAGRMSEESIPEEIRAGDSATRKAAGLAAASVAPAARKAEPLAARSSPPTQSRDARSNQAL